jgi:nicotinamidase-related amidase
MIAIGLVCMIHLNGNSQEINKLQNKYIIVLDVQQYWTDNALTKHASEEMLSAINALIEKTIPEKIIYVKTMAGSKVLSISFKGIHVDTVSAGGFNKNLLVINDNIFEKKDGDAFTVPELTAFLEQNNAKEIIITGLLADKCVYNTGIGGLSRNYEIYLIPEAIGGKSVKSKEKAIANLVKKGAKRLKLSDF